MKLVAAKAAVVLRWRSYVLATELPHWSCCKNVILYLSNQIFPWNLVVKHVILDEIGNLRSCYWFMHFLFDHKQYIATQCFFVISCSHVKFSKFVVFEQTQMLYTSHVISSLKSWSDSSSVSHCLGFVIQTRKELHANNYSSIIIVCYQHSSAAVKTFTKGPQLWRTPRGWEEEEEYNNIES